MNKLDILQTIISAAGFSGIFTVIIFFVLKHWFLERLRNSVRHEYEIKLETHKADLARDFSVQIERIKAELAQQQFRYSRVFNKTENVIANVYKMLLELKDASEGIAGADTVSKGQRFDVYLKKAKDFLNFYEPNKIYIPKNTAMKAKNLFHTLQDAVVQWHVAVQVSGSPMSEVGKNKDLFEKYLATTKEIPDLLNQIEIDFQTVLGFPMENK